MIDIKALRADPKPYQDSASRRGTKLDIDALLSLDKQRTKLIVETEGLRAKLNVKGKPTTAQLKTLKTTKTKLENQEAELAKLETKYQELLLNVPNLLADDTPEGGEADNRVEKTWGKAQKQPELKDHQTLATENGWLDFERGAKVAGNKFYYQIGPLVKLELALKRLALAEAEAAGFIAMDVPHLVNGRILAGSGFTPRGEQEQQVYQVENEDLYLIGTAEIPLAGYHADETLDLAQPKLYVGWSPSYRREAGAYGKHSKGLFRVHQFNKLELFVFCAPESSIDWLDKLVQLQENIVQKLEIPYRVSRTAAGDMGAPHYQKYDLEYWSPVESQYRELTSASNCTDFQARRLGVKQSGASFAHTLNGTAVAISRTMIAILENHQQADGRVKLPKALRKIYGAKFL